MALKSSDLQSYSDLDSVRNSCNVLICTFTNFRSKSNYPGLVENGRPYGRKVLHLLQSPSNVPTLRVDEPDQIFSLCSFSFLLLPERRYVDLVVFEVFQVKSFNIKGGECVVVPAFGDIAYVILSRDILFLHILYIWLEILLTDDCSFEVARWLWRICWCCPDGCPRLCWRCLSSWFPWSNR